MTERAEYSKCDGPSCPHCGETVSTVKDSRPYRADRTYTRRRRECQECKGRFTTYESTSRLSNLSPDVIRKLRVLRVEIDNLLSLPRIEE